MSGEHSYGPGRSLAISSRNTLHSVSQSAAKRGDNWIAYTVKSRPPTITCMQILNTPSMVISPDSKRGQGSTGIGAPEFPVPAR
jgi:hypothetical protein